MEILIMDELNRFINNLWYQSYLNCKQNKV
jgi:hypothetical protein